MKKSIRIGIAVGIWCICGSVNAFDVVNSQGDKSSFSDITNSGQWLVVMLWAHDCIPCERQKPMLSSFAAENDAKGIAVLGMSTDDAENFNKAKAVMSRSRTKFNNYLYQGSKFDLDYHSVTGERFLGTPTYLVYNPSGQLSGMHVGPIKRAELTKHFKDKRTEQPLAVSADVFQ